MISKQNIQLFEYANAEVYGTKEAVDQLEKALQNIWSKRSKQPFYKIQFEEEKTRADQQILSIDRHHKIKAKNYVGAIQQEGKTIHLLPKIFYTKEKKYTSAHINHIYQHFLWWLSYAKQPNVPLFLAKSTPIVGNILEIMMYLFADYTAQVLQNQQFQTYETVNRTLPTVKGRLQLTTYIQQHLAKGKWTTIPCQYDTLKTDNLLNQLIKYVATQLLHQTKELATQRKLREVLQYLHPISDRISVIEDCDKIKLNPIYQEWEIIINYCRLFLSQSTYIAQKGSLNLLAFLLPMEQIFESFVFGFLQQNFPNYRIVFQEQTTYLATNEKAKPQFQLRHDISLYKKNKELVLIDCKYKKIYQQNGQIVGLVINDLYQIATYAFRRACKEVYLFYPNHQNSSTELIKTYFDIQDEFSKETIKIWVCEIPFMSSSTPDFGKLEQQLLFLLQGLFD